MSLWMDRAPQREAPQLDQASLSQRAKGTITYVGPDHRCSIQGSTAAPLPRELWKRQTGRWSWGGGQLMEAKGKGIGSESAWDPRTSEDTKVHTSMQTKQKNTIIIKRKSTTWAPKSPSHFFLLFVCFGFFFVKLSFYCNGHGAGNELLIYKIGGRKAAPSP